MTNRASGWRQTWAPAIYLYGGIGAGKFIHIGVLTELQRGTRKVRWSVVTFCGRKAKMSGAGHPTIPALGAAGCRVCVKVKENRERSARSS